MTVAFALVLNAGSSSLKFCVFRRPETGQWQLDAKGQIEGIGTSPRLSVKDGAAHGLRMTDWIRRVDDGRKAVDALAAWLRSEYRGGKCWASVIASFTVAPFCRPNGRESGDAGSIT